MARTVIAFVGGFLGAGKTTTILAAAARLREARLRVGVITNDQGGDLVDALLVRDQNIPNRFVTRGCFCCQFDALEERVHELVSQEGAEVVLAEAVGSCTDISATVLNPLRRRRGDAYVYAPITIVVDAHRLRTFLNERTSDGESDLDYLYLKQLEEADVVLLNKTDEVDEVRIQELVGRLRALVPWAYVLRVSAKTGRGLDQWLRVLGTPGAWGQHILDVDYDRYARAEAALGWLNATIESNTACDWRAFAEDFLQTLLREIQGVGRPVHVKLHVETPDGWVKAAAAAPLNLPSVAADGNARAAPARIVLNVRAVADPDALRQAVETALRVTCENCHVEAAVSAVESFRPSYPKPTHRDSEPAPA
ncbi:MAG: hypothetical protein HYT80_00170 [Euryarchaeota archaeon]|nr:hypothetical protein [Euryarchaeota archaeon]